MKPWWIVGLVVLPPSAHANTRSSASYAMVTEAFASGAPQVGSASYALDGALDAAGGSVATSPNFTVKPGYIGQLYDVTALTITATPDPVGEGATSQLGVEATLDDLSTLIPSASSVDWQVVSGPLSGISVAGLATAGAVYQSETATVQGEFNGMVGSCQLGILDVEADNYLGYGGDGVNDAWQVTHFGVPPNNDAGPAENPDHDPFDNLFESLTGFDPNNANDFLRFLLTDPGDGAATLRLSKVIPGTIYTVKRSPDLGASVPFAAFPSSSFTVPSEMADFEVTDSGASGPRQFYLLEVEAE